MKAIETTGTIDDRGMLCIDRPLALANRSHIRIIVLACVGCVRHQDFRAYFQIFA